MKWSLHKQPADQIADHEYSIWFGDEPIILANMMPGHDWLVLNNIVNLLNANSAETSALRGQE